MTLPSTTDVGRAVATYFDAWRARDFDTLRGVLDDDVTFVGPLGRADNADECLAGLRGLREILSDIAVERTFVDGDDVLTWFTLHTTVAGEVGPVVNWCHVENGKITRIRVTFDPRPLIDAGS
jgi:ketosteroid isomerase-like protein